MANNNSVWSTLKLIAGLLALLLKILRHVLHFISHDGKKN